MPKFLNTLQAKITLLLFVAVFVTVYAEARYSELNILRLQVQNMKTIVNSLASILTKYVEKIDDIREKAPGFLDDDKLKNFRVQFNAYLTSIMDSAKDEKNDFFLFIFVIRGNGKVMPSASYVNDDLLGEVSFPKGIGPKEFPAVMEEFHRANLAPIEKMINKNPAYTSKMAALPVIFDGQVSLYPKAMIRESGGVAGWVVAGILRKQVISFRIENLKQYAFWGLILFAIVFAISYFVSRHITSPIPVIVKGMKAVQEGDLDVSVDVRRGDETGLLASTFNEMVKGLKRGLMVENNFKKYVSRQVADELLNSGFEMKAGGESRKVTVLFADIRNFTTISEKRPPEEVVTILNCYFSEMIDVIFKYNGTLDKFIGDAIMATFGVPKGAGDDAKRAVLCAIEMHKRLFYLNKRKNFPEDVTIEIGVGINTGQATAGVIGSNDRMEYTVIGDTVNIASRLEGLNKEFNSKVLVSASTFEEVKDIIRATDLGEHKVKGREQKTRIYAVNGVVKKGVNGGVENSEA
ncbi:MAG TPA: adenylate/guanylate cyclase domain-containing protein [Candidatus Wallbacteria bacterium]|nr:adenylate/guanylate cyclase domain-containing protein [Candidatus Wallbacteria bacterium]